MKHILLLALLAAATIQANAQAGQAPLTKEQRKAARQAKQPQVYKGTVAERRRVVTDAPGAENDRDGDGYDDATTTKSGKKTKTKN